MGMEIIKGLATTLKELGKKPTTVSYPEEKRDLPPRFRGRHVLHRYENGLERCVGCYLCAGACPADAIYIEAEENTDEHRVSPGERYARIFDVNLLLDGQIGLADRRRRRLKPIEEALSAGDRRRRLLRRSRRPVEDRAACRCPFRLEQLLLVIDQIIRA